MPTDLVTVFGASGFVGRHAVRALAARGYRIRAVCRKPNLANFLLPAGQVGQIQIVKGNINNEDDIARALAGAAAVVNAAGVLAGHGAQSLESINCDAPGRVARAALAAGVATLVHVSAIGADTEAMSEYARTKGLGERAVREGFPRAVIMRPSLVFGPEDDFFNRFASMARFMPALPLIGGGHTKFQPVFVGDVAAAIARAVDEKAMSGRSYQLGGPKVYSFRELIEFILRQTGRGRLLVPLPFLFAKIMGFFLQIPSFVLTLRPMLTVDQVRLLKSDNVVQPGAFTLDDLDINPASVETVVPTYLWRFHPKGQFGAQQQPAAE